MATAATLAADKKPMPWEKPFVAGKLIYRDNCIVCHAIEEGKPDKMGPSMFRFLQNELTPLTQAKPTEGYLKIKIQYGGDIMPAFINRLSERNINDLIDYIRSRE